MHACGQGVLPQMCLTCCLRRCVRLVDACSDDDDGTRTVELGGTHRLPVDTGVPVGATVVSGTRTADGAVHVRCPGCGIALRPPGANSTFACSCGALMHMPQSLAAPPPYVEPPPGLGVPPRAGGDVLASADLGLGPRPNGKTAV